MKRICTTCTPGFQAPVPTHPEDIALEEAFAEVYGIRFVSTCKQCLREWISQGEEELALEEEAEACL
jgi:hypothetical protein